MKITMNIEAGCPTGSTRDWTDGITIEIDSSLARDFVGNIMEYARQEAKADHWQVSDSYIVRVTYETTVQGYNADDIEEAIWVGDYEIGKLPDGTEIRADAEDVEIVEA